MKPTRVSVLLIALVVSIPVVFAETLRLTYDANGNLISGDGKFRVYNDLNQLAEVRNGSNVSSPLLERYDYHPVEERIWVKYVYDNSSLKETVIYVNENYVQVRNSSGNYSTVYVKHEGQLVAQHSAASIEYLISDPYGAYTLVTNEVGTIVENTTYGPYGNILAGGATTRFDYEGKEYDPIAGDYDFHARKYTPPFFMQPDMIISQPFNPQGWNRYSFELNNPQKYLDPDGRATVLFEGGLSDAAARTGMDETYDQLDSEEQEVSRVFSASESIDEAEAFVNAQIQKDPNQPINIVGHSRGALKALELKNSLEKRSIEVTYTATVDPFFDIPERTRTGTSEVRQKCPQLLRL